MASEERRARWEALLESARARLGSAAVEAVVAPLCRTAMTKHYRDGVAYEQQLVAAFQESGHGS